MTPIVVKLFECLDLNPVPVLPFIILNINIAGLTTLIGHPPNLLITENSYVAEHNINFLTYAMHMSVGVILALIQTNIHLRIQCRNIHQMIQSSANDDREYNIWQKCFNDIESNAKGDDVQQLKMILEKKLDSLKYANKLNLRSLSTKQLKQSVRILFYDNFPPNTFICFYIFLCSIQ